MITVAKSSHWRFLLDLILPAQCRTCRRDLRKEASPFFCRDCWDTVSRIDGPCCPCCGMPFASAAALSHSPGHLCGDCRERLPHFDQAVAAGWYEGVLAEGIHLFKYQGRTLLTRPLGGLLLSSIKRLPEADVLAPVPLHPSRLREREFNQALLLCDYVGAASGFPVIPDALERIRVTPPQIGLSHEYRRRNVRKAFAPKRPERFEGRRVILIDDVLTTGATVNECARILKRAGAESVFVLTVARTPAGPG